MVPWVDARVQFAGEDDDDCSSNNCYFLSFSSEGWGSQVTAKSTTIFQFNLKLKIDTKRIEEMFLSS